MLIRDTAYASLREHCKNAFGEDKGASIFQEVEAQFEQLQENADYKNNEMIREYMQKKLFPMLAYYNALKSSGYPMKDALDLVRKESSESALNEKENNARFAKMPFTYLIYRMGVKSHLKKHFPSVGWNVEWVRCDRKEIHFDLTRCIYHDLTVQHGCPELCTVFCENDDIAFSGLLPKIRFERKGTLGNGADRCDFRFIKG